MSRQFHGRPDVFDWRHRSEKSRGHGWTLGCLVGSKFSGGRRFRNLQVILWRRKAAGWITDAGRSRMATACLGSCWGLDPLNGFSRLFQSGQPRPVGSGDFGVGEKTTGGNPFFFARGSRHLYFFFRGGFFFLAGFFASTHGGTGSPRSPRLTAITASLR